MVNQRRRRPFYPPADSKETTDEVGLGPYMPTKALKLDRANRVLRLAFASEHGNWTTEWSHVFFSGRSSFCDNIVDGRERMWNYRRESYNQTNFTETVICWTVGDGMRYV